MRSWTTPTDSEVDRAVALITRREQHRHFFERLGNPQWIDPLRERGFFKTPPAAVRDDAEGTVSFPPWPQSRFLARIAKEAPDKVLNVILQLPDTENIRVREDLIDAALVMPPEFAVRLVPSTKRWIRTPYHTLIPDKLGALIQHLAEGGQLEGALTLARALLAVEPDTRRMEQGLSPQPKPLFGGWEYRQILQKHFPAVVETAGLDSLGLLLSILEAAVGFMQTGAKPHDASFVWRPAVEEHEQNKVQDQDTENALVSAIRDAAEQLVRGDRGSISEVVSVLESHEWHICKRIALHLLRIFANDSPRLVSERLTDRALFDSADVRHEYTLLQREQFHNLGGHERNLILGWIEEGPDIKSFSERHQRETGTEPSRELIERYARFRQRDRLAPIADALPEGWKKRYDELVAELGEAEHPEFPFFMSRGWIGPTTPKSADDLRAMSVDELISFLTGWERPDDPFAAPSELGLAREFEGVVSAEPERYADAADRFKLSEPTYVRAIFNGLREAIREKRPFDWPKLLELARWVIKQPEPRGRDRDDFDKDPNWGWTKSAIADVLAMGFERNEIPIEFRAQVWRILEPITNEDEPTLEYEAQYGDSNMDPYTLSINTTRGKAMHAVVQYALWVRRYFDEHDDMERATRGFAEIPEVQSVLDRHLEPEVDRALTIRAIYGRWLPWLRLLDRDWAISNVGRIFPRTSGLTALRDAAWESYIAVCPPYDDVFEDLEDKYAQAIERIGTASPDARHLRDPDEALAEHLMVMYWRGKLPLSEGLLTQFFETADDRLRAHALDFVGRSMNTGEESIPDDFLDRVKSLWRTRLEAAKKSSKAKETHRSELGAFGWWFASKWLDTDWAADQLTQVLQLVGWAEPDHLVVRRLGELAPSKPLFAVESLRAMVAGDEKGWHIYGWRDEARAILSGALRGSSKDGRQAAAALINDLGARGYFDFRELLTSTTGASGLR